MKSLKKLEQEFEKVSKVFNDLKTEIEEAKCRDDMVHKLLNGYAVTIELNASVGSTVDRFKVDEKDELYNLVRDWVFSNYGDNK